MRFTCIHDCDTGQLFYFEQPALYVRQGLSQVSWGAGINAVSFSIRLSPAIAGSVRSCKLIYTHVHAPATTEPIINLGVRESDGIGVKVCARCCGQQGQSTGWRQRKYNWHLPEAKDVVTFWSCQLQHSICLAPPAWASFASTFAFREDKMFLLSRMRWNEGTEQARPLAWVEKKNSRSWEHTASWESKALLDCSGLFASYPSLSPWQVVTICWGKWGREPSVWYGERG